MSWSEMSPYVKHVAARELTEKQLRILQDTINGHSATTISRAYGIAPSTVRYHLDRALKNLEPFLDPGRKDKIDV